MDKQEAVKLVAKMAAIISASGEGSIDQAIARSIEILKGAEDAVEKEYAKKEEKRK